jgi:hypothetical protein
MGLGHAGQYIGDITCPICNKVLHQPQALTDGKYIYIVCDGHKFRYVPPKREGKADASNR